MEGVENAFVSGLSVLYALLHRFSSRTGDAVPGASSFYSSYQAALFTLLPTSLHPLRFWEQSQLQAQQPQQQHQLQPQRNRAAVAGVVAKIIFSTSVIYVASVVLFELLSSLCRRAARRSPLFSKSLPGSRAGKTKQQGDERVTAGLELKKTAESHKSAAAAAAATTQAMLLVGQEQDSPRTFDNAEEEEEDEQLQKEHWQPRHSSSTEGLFSTAASTKEAHASKSRTTAVTASSRNPGSFQGTASTKLLSDEIMQEPGQRLHTPKWSLLLSTLVNLLLRSISGYLALLGLIILYCDDASLFTNALRPTYKPTSAAILSLTALASTLQLFKGMLLCVVGVLRSFRSSKLRTVYENSSNKQRQTSRAPPSPLTQLYRVYFPVFFTGCLIKGIPFAHALIILYLFGFAVKQLLRSIALTAQLYCTSKAAVEGPDAAAAAAPQHPQEPTGHELLHANIKQRRRGRVAEICLAIERVRALLQPVAAIIIAVTALYHPLLQHLPGSSHAALFAKFCMVVEVLFCFSACTRVIERYFKSLRPVMFTFLLFFHLFAVTGLLLLFSHPRRWRIFLETYVLYVLTGLGITCGAHRLWSHRSYKAGLPYRCLMLFLNSVANQGSIYHWARDHRVHHKHSDTKADPYNAARGFFYSHVGWLLLKKPEDVRLAGHDIDCSDLLKDGCVRLQKELDPWWNQTFCFVLPALYGYFVYGDFWLGFFVHGVLRWCVCLHATWTVNSVAHFWGDRPYSSSTRPRESLFTSFVAVGEGWHNWHHLYPFDYATAEGGFFQHYNPSKLVIDAAAQLRMVWDRRRATAAWQRTLEKREQQRQQQQQEQPLSEQQQLQLLQCIRSAIPSRTYRIHTFRNLAAVMRDLLLLASVYWLLLRLDTGLFTTTSGSSPSSSSTTAEQHASAAAAAASAATSSPAAAEETFAAHVSSSPFFQGLEFVLLLLLRCCFMCVSGSLAFSLFLHATRAAQGKLCAAAAANHVVAFLLHALLLVPYKPRRLGHRCEAPATRTALYTCCFRLLLLAGASCWQSSFFCCISLTCCYGYIAVGMGFWKEIAVLLLMPHIFSNCCMAYFYGALQSGAPHDSTNETDELRLPSPAALQWLLNTRRKEKKQQQQQQSSSNSCLARLLHMLHKPLQDRHLVEAVTFDVSSQGLAEAAGVVRQVVDVFAAAATERTSFDSMAAAAAAATCVREQQQEDENVDEKEEMRAAAAPAAAKDMIDCCYPAEAAVNKKYVQYAVHKALNQEDVAAADLLHTASAAAATTPCAREVAAAAAKAFGS